MTIELHRLKVLLIDDESFVRNILSQILNTIGIKNVYQSDTVVSGLSETMRVRPNLVFCDIHMPGEDGFVYVSEIRNGPMRDIAVTPVVMLTSDSGQGAVLTAKDLKVNGYLIKPVSLLTVKRVIERALKITLP